MESAKLLKLGVIVSLFLFCGLVEAESYETTTEPIQHYIDNAVDAKKLPVERRAKLVAIRNKGLSLLGTTRTVENLEIRWFCTDLDRDGQNELWLGNEIESDYPTGDDYVVYVPDEQTSRVFTTTVEGDGILLRTFDKEIGWFVGRGSGSPFGLVAHWLHRPSISRVVYYLQDKDLHSTIPRVFTFEPEDQLSNEEQATTYPTSKICEVDADWISTPTVYIISRDLATSLTVRCNE